MSTTAPAGRPWWLLPALLVVGGLVAAVLGIVVYGQGVVSNPYPSYVQGEASYDVVRYSAPWIAGGIGLLGVALLLLIGAAIRLVRRLRPAAMPSLPPYPLPGIGDA